MHRMFAFLAMMLLIGGCAGPAARFAIIPLGNQKTFTQEFSRAYITREAGGDYQIALLADPVDLVDLGKPGTPLNQASVSPLRQIVLIRVLWRPMKGARFDYPVANNAVLHWYIFDRTASETGWVHYAGNAFVAVYPQSTNASVEIRNASVALVEQCGQLRDPIGPSGIKSSFDATSDDFHVELLQKEARSLRQVGAPASQPTTMPRNQPPPRPMSP